MTLYNYFCTAICNPSCVHGTCTSPDYCACDVGWEGLLCDNGKSVISLQLHHAYKLWHYISLFPILRAAMCDPACLNGGRCNAPNQCTCTAEYTGNTCEEGSQMTCHARACTYTKVYLILDSISIAICFPPDGCVNGGECVRPSLCACQAGWSGRRCEQRKPIHFIFITVATAKLNSL